MSKGRKRSDEGRVEERIKRMRARSGEKKEGDPGREGRGTFSMVTSIFEHNSCASEPRLNLLSE